MATGDGVSSPDQLRSYAVDCARLARGATASGDKARLLNMAQAWTYLAGRIERLGRFAKGDTPAAAEPPAAPEALHPKREDESSR
jgi:hypothetical protein